ncbi:MAG: glycoside hydrolase family 95 protein [Oscillospiraceae bacterium]|nr:glycoside hydrolase family 95 protein [Oscillospiraceae bacterium]
MNDKKIWFKTPAPTGEEKRHEWYGGGWNEALPIGNGSIGAMVYGDPKHDTLQLNEDTIWYGNGGRNRVNPKAKDSFKKVRELLLEGRIKEAQDITAADLFARPDQERFYDTAGNVWFEYKHGEVSDYTRSLDLSNAVCEVLYTADGCLYKREYFVSQPDRVVAVHHTALNGGKLNLSVDFSRRDRECEIVLNETGIAIYQNQPEGGCRYCVMAAAENVGGVVIFNEKGCDVYEADEFTLYITVRTDYHKEEISSWCEEKLVNALESGYDAVKARHIADYKKYFDRVSLNIDCEDLSHIPTDERIKNAELDDRGLAQLYFDYGRYLLISCSRPGTVPANLQGIWNKDHNPAWGSKFTININTEMNYWPAEVCNLSEMHEPLFDHLRKMLPYGKKVAHDMYGMRGFVAHHNTDLFGDCAPQDCWMPATVWPMGAAWLSTHIITHYEYTKDIEFLRENIDILKEVCLFFTDYLFEVDGKLLTGPSTSPENTYIHPSGESGHICVGPTMDSQIIKDVFTACVDFSKHLGLEDDLTATIEEMLPKLPAAKIGKHGQIMEWYEDYDEAEPGHRHISHLYGLHPSCQFTYEKTPELMAASRVTLERRLASGGGHTGWSRAWIINMWARLRDGEKAGENVEALLHRSTYPNMFDMHPPFQIDGNFGGTAGIAEMLMQSQNGIIVLLPALPKKWASGSVNGLKARGNVSVDIAWQNGEVVSARLTALSGGELSFICPEGCAYSVDDEVSATQGDVVKCIGNGVYSVNIYKI